MFGDRGYDHDKYRRLVRQRGIRAVIAEPGQPHGTGLGTFRYVVERTIAWLRGGDEIGHLAALAGWLRGERDLDGTVQVRRRSIAEKELGSGLDAISVAVGTGGIGVALTQSLSAWLRTQRADSKVTFTASGRTTEIDAQRVKDPASVIAQVPNSAEDTED